MGAALFVIVALLVCFAVGGVIFGFVTVAATGFAFLVGFKSHDIAVLLHLLHQ